MDELTETMKLADSSLKRSVDLRMNRTKIKMNSDDIDKIKKRKRKLTKASRKANR